MKYNLLILLIFAFMALQLYASYFIKGQRDVYYLLPDDGSCAVKEMFFKDKHGVVQEAVDRMVCHWDLR
jgi:hypothetical protein